MDSRARFSVFVELGILFLPAVPAYLWIWPNLDEMQTEVFQVLVYLFFLAGGLTIGRRRFTWDDLGFNWNGFWLCSVCAAALLGGRLLIILGIDWAASPDPLTWTGALGDVLFYFACVGLVEELLFRGLIYRVLEDWRGARWAIWGSSVVFSLWHVFGQGPLAGAATFLIGLLFALIRRSAGGIVWLIVLHALWDLESAWLVSDSNADLLNPAAFTILHWGWLRAGTLLLLFAPAFAGWVYPRLARRLRGV